MNDLQNISRSIAQGVQDNWTEQELLSVFLNAGFFSALGYGQIGQDIRIEKRVAGGRVDLVLRTYTGRPLALFEFKRPSVQQLEDFQSQLERYVKELAPNWAVLTNGRVLLLYEVHQERGLVLPPKTLNLETLSDSEAQDLYHALHRRRLAWEHLPEVEEALGQAEKDPIFVTSIDSPGARQFLDRFALSHYTPFGRLTQALMEALPPLLQRSNFAQGAYGFWEQAYARKLSKKKIPRAWKEFLPLKTELAVFRFMFSLETAYTIFSRLILAKAIKDVGFPHMKTLKDFKRPLEEKQMRGRVPLSAYVYAVQEVFRAGSNQAFSTLFEQDIFDWWRDAPEVSNAGRPDFSSLYETLAETALAVFEFNFSQIRGDLLGLLYQSYFDPETRKALGEFYTPPEVVDFILDQIGYRGPGVLTRRLLDPACGSGTFLVHALRRYLEAAEGQDPVRVLKDLIYGLRIVGLDINPFAVLMSQVNYATHLLPLYAKAVQRDPSLVLSDLPVLRTDSLRKETREHEQESPRTQKGMPELALSREGDIAYIRLQLPIRMPRKRKNSKEEFVEVRIPVPQFMGARSSGLVNNVEEYFQVLQILFQALRKEQTDPEILANEFRYRGFSNAQELARFVQPALEGLRETLMELTREFEDGRFLKAFEHLALALLVKNDFSFDYVVGNPPYVRIQNIPELLRRYWAAFYAWAEGNYDMYIPFIERAVTEWLADGGYLGFICSDRFLVDDYARALRENLPQYADVRLLFDMRDTRVFRDALNYPAILIVQRRNKPQEEGFIAARAFADPGEGPARLIDEARHLIERARRENTYRRGEHVDAFPERREHLTATGWYLMPEYERTVFDKLEAVGTHRLYQLTLTRSGGFQGWSTSADGILVLRLLKDEGNVLVLEPKGGGNPVRIERDVLRPWLFGRNVERWHIAWAGWYVFFPYTRINNRYQLIPSTPYREKFEFAAHTDYTGPFLDTHYPRAWEYVKRHERELRNREDGLYRKGTTIEHMWYGATYPRSIEYYALPKIVLQMASQSPDMAYDTQHGYIFQAGGHGGGVYGIVVDPEVVENTWFLLSLLNSRPLDFYLKHTSKVYTGRTYSYSDPFIKNLPIRLPQNEDEEAIAQDLADLAQELTHTKGKLREWEKKRKAFPEPFLYELGPVDLYPFTHLITGERKSRSIRTQKVTFQLQQNGRWAIKFGRTTFVFPSEPHARLAEAWLGIQERASVPVDNLLNLRVPARPEDAQRLLGLLKAAENEIDQLQSRLDKGETKVNHLVARLYGLKDEDVQVIEDFLDRF